MPTTGAISQARERLGEAPVKLPFEKVAAPLAAPGALGAWGYCWRPRAPDVNSRSNYGQAPAAGEGPTAITGPAAAERAVRELRVAGQLTEAVRVVGHSARTAPDGPDATTSLGASVLEAYADQLAATDPAAADAAYRNAAADQRSFAAAATSGGEGAARIAEADRIDAKRHR